MISEDEDEELLPPLFEGWMRDLLRGPIPRETRATCRNCAMAEPCAKTDRDSSTDYFNPRVKCCTFVPTVPNFLVGRILSDRGPEAAEGLATIEKRIDRRIGVTPLGLAPSAVFSTLYNFASEFFGKSPALRCPHYLEDGGRCGIWRNREATCATWFCKHVRGRVGHDFWIGALHPLLSEVERELSKWCLLELGWSGKGLAHAVSLSAWEDAAEHVTTEAIEDLVEDREYRRMWDGWEGRERDFYLACSGLVNTLSWGEVLMICGQEVRALSLLAEEAYRKLTSAQVPERFKPGSLQIIQLTAQTTRAVTYLKFDPIEVPNVVVDVLRHFDGRSNEEVKQSVLSERGVEIDDSLIRKLADFDVLVES